MKKKKLCFAQIKKNIEINGLPGQTKSFCFIIVKFYNRELNLKYNFDGKIPFEIKERNEQIFLQKHLQRKPVSHTRAQYTYAGLFSKQFPSQDGRLRPLPSCDVTEIMADVFTTEYRKFRDSSCRETDTFCSS